MNPTATTPPLFMGTGAFRPLTQPSRARREVPFLPPPTTPDSLLHAAFIAEGAIERIHDLTSLDTASQALLHYERTLLDATPDMQVAARDRAFVDGLVVPTVFALTSNYLTAWRQLYQAAHATRLPFDPAI